MMSSPPHRPVVHVQPDRVSALGVDREMEVPANCSRRVQAAFGLLIQLGHTQDWVRGQQLTNLRRATIVLTLCQKEVIMEVAIRKMGNSQGVLIPKPILIQVGLDGTADLQVRNGVIEIRAVRRNPREGWADDARHLAELGGDALVWPEVANEGDHELVW